MAETVESFASQDFFRSTDGQSFTIRAEPAPKRDSAHDDDDRRFDGIAGALGSLLALLAALLVTWMLSLFISRRLLGTGLHKGAHGVLPPSSAHHGVLFYSRRIPSEEV